ncbi:hypothetical protein AX15_002489 [Amanita polypyramis BW_CC]|nr:hypothetical protein AX15_002489 [Amanita polypyramis BW_CC]
MANAAAKRIASQNESTIKFLKLGIFIPPLISFLLRFLLRRSSLPPSKTSLAIYIVTYFPAFFLSNYLIKIGTPRRDPTTGTLISYGEDLNQKGVTEWCFDIIYITWICQIGSGLFGDWFWSLYMVIPLYAVFKLCISVISPLILGQPKDMETSTNSSTTEEHTSKRQQKMKKRSDRGDPRVKDATPEHQSPQIIERTGDIDVEMTQLHFSAALDDLNVNPYGEISNVAREHNTSLDICTSATSVATSPVPEDAISSSPTTVEHGDYDCHGESDIACGEDKLTYLTLPYDSSTMTYTSSLASEALLSHEDKVSCDILSSIEIGNTPWTPPPSSSPLQDLSQTMIMSSPIRQATVEDKEGGNTTTHPQSSPSIEEESCDEYVNDTNDPQGVARSGKRKRSESLSALGQPGDLHIPESEFNSAHRNLMPNPKRLTVRSQLLQHEKLKTPFRSPLLRSERHGAAVPQLSSSSNSDGTSESDQVQHAMRKALPNSSNKTTINNHNAFRDPKYRTASAATQFKSPLSSDTIMKLRGTVRMTPDIQMLERRLQFLKRALKIKQEDQEHVLEDLVRKWTEAGREVAWELWSLVKDNGSPECGAPNCVGFWSSNVRDWGWNESKDERHNSEEHHNVSGVEFNDIDHSINHSLRDSNLQGGPMENSLGIMLRQLGIDPKILGWDEGEGMFVDN